MWKTVIATASFYENVTAAPILETHIFFVTFELYKSSASHYSIILKHHSYNACGNIIQASVDAYCVGLVYAPPTIAPRDAFHFLFISFFIHGSKDRDFCSPVLLLNDFLRIINCTMIIFDWKMLIVTICNVDCVLNRGGNAMCCH